MKYLSTFIFPLCCFLFLFSCSNGNGGVNNGGTTNPGKKGNVTVYSTVRYTSTELAKQNDIDFSSDVSYLTIRLDTTDLKQEIDGFGGALTGSSAYLINNMPQAQQDSILSNLFSNNGIAIKNLRISIGSSDFSLGNYTYCDQQGIDHFAIPDLDKRDLLPVLKKILKINPDIKIIASPWTAPAWMKGNNNLYGGSLKGSSVYDDFAEYFVKYIQALQGEGISIYAITIQNEPMNENSTYPTMKMSWQEQNTIIRDYLGKKFKNANLSTKILILDHNFDEVDYPINILSDSQTKQYVSGVAFHGYGGTPADLSQLISADPQIPIYFTEQSGGGWNTDEPIGNMMYYMKDMIIPTINYGSKNFLMWNLALNENDGPVTTTSGGCQDCRGVMKVKNDFSSFSKNEEYYMLGHFSKFIQEGAHRIGNSVVGNVPNNFEYCTFLNPDGSKVIVILNQSGSRQVFTVRTGSRRFTYAMSDQSVVTFVYK